VLAILQAPAHPKEAAEALFPEAEILAHLAVAALVQLALMGAVAAVLKSVEMAVLALQVL
jgi:hypothetical protein